MKSLKIMAVAALLGTSSLLSSCASFSSASGESLSGQAIASNGMKPVAHVNGCIYGFYLFGVVPLASGDPKTGEADFFADNATLAKTVDMLSSKSRDLGSSAVLDMDSRILSRGAYSLWIVWYREAQVSGNAVR